MALAATYNDATASVTLAINATPVNASTALVERSTDQVTWAAIRGGVGLPLASGAASLVDYEYLPGVANYYRARYSSAAPIAFAAGIVGQVASPVPATNTITLTGLGTQLRGDALTVVVSLSAAPTSGGITCATTGWTVSPIGTLGAVLTAPVGASAAANPAVSVTLAAGTVLNWTAFRYANAALPPTSSTSQVTPPPRAWSPTTAHRPASSPHR